MIILSLHGSQARWQEVDLDGVTLGAVARPTVANSPVGFVRGRPKSSYLDDVCLFYAFVKARIGELEKNFYSKPMLKLE